MDRDAFGRWLQAYFAAWVSNEPDDVAALFTEDATYVIGPFGDVGKARRDRPPWTSGAEDDVRYAYEVLAAEGETGIADERHGPVEVRDQRVEWTTSC